MHPSLLAAMTDIDLATPERNLFAYVYANTNGDRRCEIPIHTVLDDCGITTSTLRRYRGNLAKHGYMESRLIGGNLICVISERAPDARSVHETRAVDNFECAPDARSVHEARAVDNSECAPDARSVHETRETCTTRAPKPDTGRLVGSKPILTQQRTNQPVPPPKNNPPDDIKPAGKSWDTEFYRSLTMLRHPEIGIDNEKVCRRLAAEHGFWWLLAQVITWQHERKTRDLGVGALINRIDKCFSPHPLGPADRRSTLYRQFVPDTEDAAREAADRHARYSNQNP